MGRSSCQQLINDSFLKRKASLVIVIVPGNKISRASNEWHQSMFGNKLMTALVTLKTLADQQNTRGSSLKVVLVVVQCMRQYIYNSPGCSTAEYTNVGGRRQYTTQSWKPLLARWTVTDRIGTVTDCIGTQTTVRLSRKINLCVIEDTSLSVLLFFLPSKNGTDTFSLSHAKFQQFFSLSISLVRVAFSLVNLYLSADRLSHEQRRFNMVTSVRLDS